MVVFWNSLSMSFIAIRSSSNWTTLAGFFIFAASAAFSLLWVWLPGYLADSRPLAVRWPLTDSRSWGRARWVSLLLLARLWRSPEFCWVGTSPTLPRLWLEGREFCQRWGADFTRPLELALDLPDHGRVVSYLRGRLDDVTAKWTNDRVHLSSCCL